MRLNELVEKVDIAGFASGLKDRIDVDSMISDKDLDEIVKIVINGGACNDAV